MGVQNRRKYDSDFKQNTVLLTQQPGRTVSDVAKKLGIDSARIYQWRKALNKKGELAFPGNGKEALNEYQKRIRDLEKRLKDTEMEREILKKAMAIFSRAQI